MTTVFVAHIDHRSGTDMYAALSQAELDAQLARWCRENWDELIEDSNVTDVDAGSVPPTNDRECIDRYFECSYEEYIYEEAIVVEHLKGAEPAEPTPEMQAMHEEFRKLAKEQYQDEGYIEIDDNAEVSSADIEGVVDPGGAYVAAWVWVTRTQGG